jgi:hypothetical protein
MLRRNWLQLGVAGLAGVEVARGLCIGSTGSEVPFELHFDLDGWGAYTFRDV